MFVSIHHPVIYFWIFFKGQHKEDSLSELLKVHPLQLFAPLFRKRVLVESSSL